MNIDMQARIEAGAKKLDQEIPDWLEKMNLETLDVSSPKKCILAQVFESYQEGLGRLFNGNYEAAARHGFFAFSALTVLARMSGGSLLKIERTEYADLTQGWKDYISSRLRGGGVDLAA